MRNMMDKRDWMIQPILYESDDVFLEAYKRSLAFNADIVEADGIIENKNLSDMINQLCGEMQGVPNDLWFANTLPLPDMTFYVDNTKVDIHIKEKSQSTFNAHYDIFYMIGWLKICDIYNKDRVYDFYGLFIHPGSKIIDVFQSSHEYHKNLNDFYNENRDAFGIALLEVWYAIQILLLHPRSVEVKRKATKQRLHGKEKIISSNSSRKVKYIRHYTITKDDVNYILDGDTEHTYNRKCLSWYVIGHWRKYKSGKKIFINGYWKGALRETKRSYDERNRTVEEVIV